MTETPPTPDQPQLDSEPEERRLLRPWHLALTGGLVGYPLSVAPVAWICRMIDPTMQFTAWLRLVYAPIKALYEAIPFVREFYDWYFSLFGVK